MYFRLFSQPSQARMPLKGGNRFLPWAQWTRIQALKPVGT